MIRKAGLPTTGYVKAEQRRLFHSAKSKQRNMKKDIAKSVMVREGHGENSRITKMSLTNMTLFSKTMFYTKTS